MIVLCQNNLFIRLQGFFLVFKLLFFLFRRWNFSVGQHDVKIASDPTASCHETTSADPSSDLLLKVIVPDGLVCALSRSKPGVVIWKHKVIICVYYFSFAFNSYQSITSFPISYSLIPFLKIFFAYAAIT